MAYFNNLTVGGTTKFLQDVKWPGLKSSVDELNYLHKEVIKKDGWYIPAKGDVNIDGYCCYTNKNLGLILNNTYTVTCTTLYGDVITESITATDVSDYWDVGVNGIIGLYSPTMDEYIFSDNVNFDNDDNWSSGGCFWINPIEFECTSILIQGTVTGGTLTHEDYSYNQIPAEHM